MESTDSTWGSRTEPRRVVREACDLRVKAAHPCCVHQQALEQQALCTSTLCAHRLLSSRPFTHDLLLLCANKKAVGPLLIGC